MLNDAGAPGVRELRGVATIVWPLLQATAAATLAWMIAKEGLGHEDPFFAPIAVGRLAGEIVNLAPEHDDVARAAALLGRPAKAVWALAWAVAERELR